MRCILLSLFVLLSFDAHAAAEDTGKRDYVKTLDEANLRFLKELKRFVEKRGYRDVRIVPQLFVAKVKGPNGEDRALIINSDTLQASPFEGELPLPEKGGPAETTIPGLH